MSVCGLTYMFLLQALTLWEILWADDLWQRVGSWSSGGMTKSTGAVSDPCQDTWRLLLPPEIFNSNF